MSEKINPFSDADDISHLKPAQNEREKNLVPLRISKTTVILVKPENCNEEYAENYRKTKMSI